MATTSAPGNGFGTAAQEYFAQPADVPGARGRFLSVAEDCPLVEVVAGLRFRPTVGERAMVSFVEFDPHVEAPVHSHEEEQIVVVLDGEVEFDVGGEVRLMRAGDVVLIPPFVPHRARTRDTPCRELDIFAPPRRALLEMALEAEHRAHGFD